MVAIIFRCPAWVLHLKSFFFASNCIWNLNHVLIINQFETRPMLFYIDIFNILRSFKYLSFFFIFIQTSYKILGNKRNIKSREKWKWKWDCVRIFSLSVNINHIISIYIYISKSWNIAFNIATLLLSHISTTSSTYFQYFLSPF